MRKYITTIGFSCILLLPFQLFFRGALDSNEVPVEPNKQKGVSLAHIHRQGLGYGSDACREVLNELSELGVEWISLTPFGYQPGLNDPEIRFGGRDITEENLVRCIEDIHSLGMQVFLKPHIWSREFSRGKWRGEIKMRSTEDWDKWFANYTKYIMHYARIAEKSKVSLLCIGLEFVQSTAEHEKRWRTLIHSIRSVYKGKITYAANWTKEIEQVSFWDELDFIGFQAYFPLAKKKHSGIDDLKKGARPYVTKLKKLAQRYGKPVLFAEAGYRSVEGASITPWLSGRRGEEDSPVSEEEQRLCYEALFQTFWNQPWFAGIYWWKHYTADMSKYRSRRGNYLSRDFTPHGKPAEETIRKWYTKGG